MIDVVPETGSTNADLVAFVRSGNKPPENRWLVADRQMSGRGRRGRQWVDGAGNFMGSTVVWLSPGDPAAASLALVAGIAVHRAVAPVLADPGALMLKWPNDLMIGRAKLAGILLEREGEAVVVGVGVNLAHAPDIAGRTAISLAQLGNAPDRDTFANHLDEAFADEVARWRQSGIETLTRRWLALAHPMGTPLEVQAPAEDSVAGTFEGLSADGALLLALADGSTRVMHAGDVTMSSGEG